MSSSLIDPRVIIRSPTSTDPPFIIRAAAVRYDQMLIVTFADGYHVETELTNIQRWSPGVWWETLRVIREGRAVEALHADWVILVIHGDALRYMVDPQSPGYSGLPTRRGPN